MEDKPEIIGLRELLDEVQRDLDELRRKHPSDYSIRNIAMWWELEKERVLMRHNPGSVVKTLHRARRAVRAAAWLLAGWITMLAFEAALRAWIS